MLVGQNKVFATYSTKIPKGFPRESSWDFLCYNYFMIEFLGIIALVGIYFIIKGNMDSRLDGFERRLKKLEGGSPIQKVQESVVEPLKTFEQPQPQISELQPVEEKPYKAPESTEESLGRTLGIIGVFAVLIGIGIFLKYAFDNDLISVTGRLVLGAGAGALALVLGRLIKEKYEKYSYVLSGGGVGVLFVTAYTAHIFYDVISAPTAYILFAIITAISVGLSILDGEMLLAGIGVAGGFIAPMVISFGGTEFFGLLTYILIIDAGIAVIAYTYKWLALNYIAFIGTLFSVIVWYGKLYGTESEQVLFIFASMYFALFLALSVFHHIVRKEKSTEGDLFFVTVNAFSYAALSYGILNPVIPEAMGLFMTGLALVYLVLGYLSFITHKEDKLLNVALPLIGVFFITIAVPIQFDGAWITTAWFIEALCLCLVDYSIKGSRLYVYASIIYLIGLFHLFAFDNQKLWVNSKDFLPAFNERFILFAFAIGCGLAIAYILHIASKRNDNEGTSVESLHSLSVFFGIITQVVTVFLLSSEIHRFYEVQRISEGVYGNYSENQERTLISIVWAVYAAILTGIGFVFNIRFVRLLGLILFTFTAVKVFTDLWALGPLYRIVSSIVFGVIALIASFAYAKFKDKLKEVL